MALPEGEGSFRRVYRRYKLRAAKKKIPFNIPQQLFREIGEQCCVYCGAEPSVSPSHATEHNGAWAWNGLDRIDNGKGYIIGNVQPCCSTCNRIKSDMSESTFLDHLTRIVSIRSEAGSIKDD